MKNFFFVLTAFILFASCRQDAPIKTSETSTEIEPQEKGKTEIKSSNDTKQTAVTGIKSQTKPVGKTDANTEQQGPSAPSIGFNPLLNKETKTEADKLKASGLKELPKDGERKKDPANLPRIKTLIDASQVSAIVGVSQSQMVVKEVTNKQNPRLTRSCFFKWEEKTNPDAGLFIQIQSNPVKDEFPTWAREFMNAKRVNGETTFPADGNVYRFVNLSGVGDEAVISHEMSKVMYRLGEDLVVTIADNYQLSDDQRVQNAKRIAKIINPQLQ